MQMSQGTYLDLFEDFLDGATEGEHRKIQIVDDGDRTLLVAYRKWVYAEREKDAGVVTVYTGWRDSERATNASNIQSGYLRQAIEAQDAFWRLTKRVKRDEMPAIDGPGVDSFQVEQVP